jgi:hypothetical protein
MFPRENTKVDMLNSNTYLNQPPTFAWHVIWCSSKNEYQKDICVKEIGLRAQNMTTILSSNSQHN